MSEWAGAGADAPPILKRPHPRPNTVQRDLPMKQPPAMMVLAITATWQGGCDVLRRHGGRGAGPLVGVGAAVGTEAYHPAACGDRGAAGGGPRPLVLRGAAGVAGGLVPGGHRAVLRRLLPPGVPVAGAVVAVPGGAAAVDAVRGPQAPRGAAAGAAGPVGGGA